MERLGLPGTTGRQLLINGQAAAIILFGLQQITTIHGYITQPSEHGGDLETTGSEPLKYEQAVPEIVLCFCHVTATPDHIAQTFERPSHINSIRGYFLEGIQGLAVTLLSFCQLPPQGGHLT